MSNWELAGLRPEALVAAAVGALTLLIALGRALVRRRRAPAAPAPARPAVPPTPPAPTAVPPTAPAAGVLAQAMAGRDGSVVASGGLRFPPDPSGAFVAAEGGWLRLTRPDLTLVACTVERRPDGFLDLRPVGPRVILPRPIETALQHALRFGARAPLVLTLQHGAGHLSPSAERGEGRGQPLSDWRAHIEEDADGSLVVRLSAALFAAAGEGPRTSFDGEFMKNWWPGDGAPARLEIDFRVDAVTRTACCGAYVPAVHQRLIADLRRPAPTTLDRLSLDGAALVPEPLGFDDGGSPWEFGGTRRYFAFTRQSLHDWTENGRTERRTRHEWPRVWIYGTDMEAVAAALSHATAARFEFSGGQFELQQHHLHHENFETPPRQTIHRADLQAGLSRAGLRLAWRAGVRELDTRVRPYQDGEVQGAITVPWEVLILRWPAFAPLAEKVG